MTRTAFEQMTDDLIERTALPVKNALRDAGIAANDLDQVLLVGGSTRMPAVQAKVLRMVDLEPSKTLNPDECVALGAAVQGGRLGGEVLAAGGENLLLMDVTPLTLSIETVGGVATHLIERNSTIPTRFSKIFTTAAPFQSTVEIKVLQGERVCPGQQAAWHLHPQRDQTCLGRCAANRGYFRYRCKRHCDGQRQGP